MRNPYDAFAAAVDLREPKLYEKMQVISNVACSSVVVYGSVDENLGKLERLELQSSLDKKCKHTTRMTASTWRWNSNVNANYLSIDLSIVKTCLSFV